MVCYDFCTVKSADFGQQNWTIGKTGDIFTGLTISQFIVVLRVALRELRRPAECKSNFSTPPLALHEQRDLRPRPSPRDN